MEIVFAGFGGQGVLTSGLIVAYAAMKGGYRTLWSSTYGAAMRGGKAYSLVKFDKKPISAPVITEPDVVVAMNQPSLDFAKSLKDDGVLIINSDIIDEGVTAETKARVIRIPVTSLAIEATKRAQPANVVAVGAVIKAIGIIDKDQSISAMKEYFEEQGKAMFNESNEAAFMAGYNYVQ